jgi:AcrR family transcriptional regulator
MAPTDPSKPAKPRRAKQKRDPERTKAKIIKAATELFMHLGLDGTSLDDISKKAGVNRGLIYHYYKTKEFLFDQVLSKPLAGFVQSHLAFLQRRKSDTESLCDATTRFFHFLGDHPDLVRLLGWTLAMQRFSIDLPQLEFTRGLYQHAVDRIEEGKVAGTIRADLDAQHLLISIIDLCVAWHLGRDEWIEKLSWSERDTQELDDERLAAILDLLKAAVNPHPGSVEP